MSQSNRFGANPSSCAPDDFTESDVFIFPTGLPGFAHYREFLLIHNEAHPLAYLQSVGSPAIRFILLPVAIVTSEYRLAIEKHDLDVLFPDAQEPTLGDVKAYFIVSVREDSAPRINMLAPIVLHTGKRLGVQAVRSDSAYSHSVLLADILSPRGVHGLQPC